MSGIAGIIRPGGPVDSGACERMVRSLRFHDGGSADSWEGPGAFLAVVSPSPRGSRWPARVAEAGDRRAVLDGVLWNEPELRLHLERLGSEPPPEGHLAALVLALFGHLGDRAFELLDGNFTLAIHDGGSDEVILSSDRFPSMPLFWARGTDGSLVFASRLHTVLASRVVSRALDHHAVREAFHYQTVHGTRTLNAAARMLGPATRLRFRGGRVDLVRWFELDYEPAERSEGEWVEELAEGLRSATRRAMRGLENPGVLTSGGQDSRMVLAATDREVHCIHFNDWENREYRLSRAVADCRGFPFRYLERVPEHYARLVVPGTLSGDGQQGFIHAHPIGFLPLQGVDGVFHGYSPGMYFRGLSVPKVARRIMGRAVAHVVDPAFGSSNAAETLAVRHKYSPKDQRHRTLLAAHLSNDLDARVLETARGLVDEARDHSDDPLDWFAWPDTRYHCNWPSINAKPAIRAYAEERSIVLHNSLLELHRRMPSWARSNGRVWARALKRLHPGLASIPDANTNRPPLTPAAVLFADRVAGWLGRRTGIRPLPQNPPGLTNGSWPRHAWRMAHEPGLSGVIREVLSDPEAIDPELFDRAEVQRLVDEHMSGEAEHTRWLWTLTTFGIWYRGYGPPGTAV